MMYLFDKHLTFIIMTYNGKNTHGKQESSCLSYVLEKPFNQVIKDKMDGSQVQLKGEENNDW